MPVEFRCEHCNAKLGVASRKIGTMVNCPACKKPVLVPDPNAPKPNAPILDIPKPAPVQSVAAPVVPQEAIIPPPPPPWFGDEEDEEEDLVLSRRADEDEGMDLTPMVDVTFLLLIFFMITASFSMQKAIQVPPPDPEESGAAQTVQMEDLQKEAIMITVNAASQVLVDDEPLNDLGELQTILETKSRTEDKNEIVITANEKALHETIVGIVDAANGAQMQRIRMTTTTEDE